MQSINRQAFVPALVLSVAGCAFAIGRHVPPVSLHAQTASFRGEELLAGRPSPWDGARDFQVDPDGNLKARELYLQDIGDPPDLAFGRAGPDDVPFDAGAPAAVSVGANLGTMYWRFWEPERGWHRRAVQIYARYQGDGAGSLHLATNPGGHVGEPDAGMVDRLVIESDGTLRLDGIPMDEHGRFRVRGPDGRIGYVGVDWER
jgi:hypothetical protein